MTAGTHVFRLALACVLGVGVPPTSAISGPASLLHVGRPHIRMTFLAASQRSLQAEPPLAGGREGDSLQRKMLQRMRGGGDNVRCKFEVRVENTKPGDTVLLLGSGALHNWDKARATELTTTKDAFPWWWTEVPIPCGDSIEFKFAIRSAEGVLTWETGVNRKAVIPDEAAHLFTFSYGDRSTPAPRGTATVDQVKPNVLQGAVMAAHEFMSPRRSRQATRSASPPPQNEEPVSSVPQQTSGTPDQPANASAGAVSERLVDTRHSQAPTSPPVLNATARATAAKMRFGASLKRTPALYSTALLAVVNGTNVAVANGASASTKSPFWKGLFFNVLRILSAPVALPIWSLYKVVSTALRILSRVYASIHAVLFEADPDKFEVGF